MTVNVNIKLVDNVPLKEYEESGVTAKLIEVIGKKAFENLLAEACVNYHIDDCTYFVDVKAEE